MINTIQTYYFNEMEFSKGWTLKGWKKQRRKDGDGDDDDDDDDEGGNNDEELLTGGERERN